MAAFEKIHGSSRAVIHVLHTANAAIYEVYRPGHFLAQDSSTSIHVIPIPPTDYSAISQKFLDLVDCRVVNSRSSQEGVIIAVWMDTVGPSCLVQYDEGGIEEVELPRLIFPPEGPSHA